MGSITLSHPNPRIFLSAGEASGDEYGAQILLEMRRRLPEAIFTGMGGPAMEGAGQDRIVRAEDVAHMGITEVLRHMPRVYGAYRRLVSGLQWGRPDFAVLIDFPDVNFRLARHCRRLGIPVVWFVSPQLWAWKRRRLRWVQQRVDRMLVIFPFEERFYRVRKVDAEFVGHPLAALPLPSAGREDYAAEHELDPAKRWIALLPGSRWKEVRLNLPAMVEMAVRFPMDAEYLVPVASTIQPGDLQLELDQQLKGWRKKAGITLPNFRLVHDARAALYHARASVVASGTATVQALTLGNPFVVVYRVSDLTFALAKRLIRYPAEIPASPDADGNLPIAMVNLIAGRRIVPELLNRRFCAANVAAALQPLLDDTPARLQMIADLAEARIRLLPDPETDSNGDPIRAVCDAIEDLLRLAARDVAGRPLDASNRLGHHPKL